MNTLVSVILIFCNEEKFLVESIESVISQSYDQWELFLIDDGSRDGSTEIALSYCMRYPNKIRYLQHPNYANCGMNASRDLGLQYSTGKYIALLDGDDVWLPQKLTQQVAILDAHPDVGMVYGNTMYWFSWTGSTKERVRDYVPNLGIDLNTVISPPTLVPLFLTQTVPVPCTCSVLIRRNLIETLGGFEKEFRYGYTDQVFYVKLCLHTRVFVSDTCLDRYRQHSNSCSSMLNKSGQIADARARFLKWVDAYLKAHKINDVQVWWALKSELWRLRHPLMYRGIKRAMDIVDMMEEWTRVTARRILPSSLQRWCRGKWRLHKARRFNTNRQIYY